MANTRLDLAGKTFGCLTVLEYDELSFGSHESKWVCVCNNCDTLQSIRGTSTAKCPKSCTYCKMTYREYPNKVISCFSCGVPVTVATNRYSGCCSDACRAKVISERVSFGRRKSVASTLHGIVIQSKSRAKRKGVEFNLTSEWALKQLEMQDGRCARTGVPLLKSIQDHVNSRRANAHTVSLDRVDCSKGYTTNNVELVSYHYNIAKNSFTNDEVLDMAKNILLKAGYEVSERQGRSP